MLSISSFSIELGIECGTLEQVCAYLAEQIPEAAGEAVRLAVEREQEMGDQGGENLDAHGVLAAAEELLDAQMLLDP